MPFDADDELAFFDPDMPGYKQALIGATVVDGRFREPSHDALGVGSTQPSFQCPTASLPAGYKTATITIDGRNFKVAGAPDTNATRSKTTLELVEQGL